jgi:hypothetical protein
MPEPEIPVHKHNFYPWNTKKEFEIWELASDGQTLYKMVEYAYVNCQCGQVKKVKIKDEDGKNYIPK